MEELIKLSVICPSRSKYNSPIFIVNPECRKFTAFTLPGIGQFEWNASPMGLLGTPGSFQRLMKIVIYNMKNVLAYIDDLLLHTKTHEEHLKILEVLFDRLRQHGLKIKD